MSILKKSFRILSSSGMLFWLITTWIVFYITAATWSSEAFEYFVEGLRRSLVFKMLFILLLANLLLHLISGVYGLRKSLPFMLLWLPLSLGLFLLLLGFLVSVNSKKAERVVLGEEDTVTAGDGEVYMVKNIRPNLKDSVLDIDEVKGFFSMEPRATLASSDHDYEVGVYPPKKLGGSYFHIMEFGLAPGIEITSGGKSVIKGYMPQRILPPGNTDTFTVNGLPFRFNVKLSPEKVIERGEVSAKVYNLRSPTYRVSIFRGEELVREGLSDKEIDFENFRIVFLDPGYWIRLEVVRDHGVTLVIAGIVLSTIGVPLRFVLLAIRAMKRRKARITS